MARTLDAYVNLPSSPSPGDEFWSTDSYYDEIVAGAAGWRHMIGGKECTLPDISDFSWVNQGSAAVVSAGGALIFTDTPGTPQVDLHIFKRSAPSPPYRVEMGFIRGTAPTSGDGFRMLFRESSSGKGAGIGFGTTLTNAQVFDVFRWSNETTPVLNLVAQSPYHSITGNVCWVGLHHTGSAIRFEVAVDGVNFLPLLSEAHNAFFDAGPNEIGMYIDGVDATYTVTMAVMHWKVELLGGSPRHYAIARLPRLRSGR